MGRGKHPGHACGAEVHIACISFHRYYRQFHFLALADESFLVEVVGKFAGGEAVEVGYGELAYEGYAVRLGEVALDFVAADGVGAVENHELLAFLGAGFHGQTHCGYECE